MHLGKGPWISASLGIGNGKNKVKANAGTRSFHVHRVLTIMTFNLSLHKLLLRTGKANPVQYIYKWYDLFTDKGVGHYFDLTRPEKDLPLYVDHFSFAKYMCKEFPKLKYVAKLMGEICLNDTDPRRVMIFTDWPMNQWNLEGILGVSA